MIPSIMTSIENAGGRDVQKLRVDSNEGLPQYSA